MRRHAILPTAAAAGLILVLSSCSSGATPSDGGDGSDAVTIAVMSGITTELVMTHGIDQGAFTDAGLDATLTGVENPPAAMAALQGGSADVAYAPLPTALTALSKGIDLKIIGAADGFPEEGQGSDRVFDDTTIFVNPADGITSPSGLDGKTVAVPSRSGLMEIAIANAVKEDGGDPGSIEWLSLDQQSQLTSLTQGRINGAGLSTPFSDRAEADGMTLLVRPLVEFFEHGAAGVWIVTSAYAEANPETVTALQAAISTSNALANDNIDELAQEVVEINDLDIPANEVVVGYFPETVKADDVQRAATKMAELGFIPEDVDLSDVVIAAG